MNVFSWLGDHFLTPFFTQPMFNALMILYHLFGDLGLSIVVLTLIIMLLLFPLTLKQLKSSKAMQALQPQLQEIRRKYAKDQQAQMLAMQALQKEYGINPLASGCLPLLIQFPVLIGMYTAFREGLTLDTNSKLTDAQRMHELVSHVNATLYPFVPRFTTIDTNLNWFAWLNPAWHISLAQIPGLSFQTPPQLFILPVIAALATFVQIRMSMPKTPPTPAKKNAQPDVPDPMTSSMKTMQYIMPFFTLYIAVISPTGLALYWTVAAIFRAIQQYFVTGWGALLVTPDMTPKKVGSTATASSNGALTSRKESVKEAVKEKSSSDDEESDEGVMATASASASKTHSSNGSRPSSNGSRPNNNSSSSQSGSRRRSSSSSASKRRRQRSRR